jgi:hypothetical protein
MSYSNRTLLQYSKGARGGDAAAARLRASPLCDTALTKNGQPVSQAL